MTYSIRVTETAKKQLSKIDKQIARRIDGKLLEIASDPFLHVTRLAGLELYKMRVGDYRVLMSIQKDKMIVMVIEIGHERNVCK
ncbi:MAG: type II toxin-antitoxin system RelE/ParE family toxin [Thaumarchaeota archaeon]|nr:type II toxin-antitoxin system RelE/ParE family toxin [Nitrososphaerota archaeon]